MLCKEDRTSCRLRSETISYLYPVFFYVEWLRCVRYTGAALIQGDNSHWFLKGIRLHVYNDN